MFFIFFLILVTGLLVVMAKGTKNPAASKVRYHWGLVFTWDHKLEKPFSMFVLDAVKEFPRNWIEQRLTHRNRHEKFVLKATGKKGSLFCKVEFGTHLYIILLKIKAITTVSIINM